MTAVRTGTGLDEEAALAVWQAAEAGQGRRNGGPRAQRVRARVRSPDALLLVAEQDGEVVGALLAELSRSGLSLGLVAVDPARQRQGVGRALVQALLARYPRVRAETDDDAGRALLLASGFRADGAALTT